ncbi:uncharacterized protein LOC135394713 isoform X2 [Ornithodoros turicata]|uniref:uncharacterized protein LOC135394713 isoform X2 n=1 Tax=Ornithodoros turicata TaxID=34597 RepID=UPI0031393B26
MHATEYSETKKPVRSRYVRNRSTDYSIHQQMSEPPHIVLPDGLKRICSDYKRKVSRLFSGEITQPPAVTVCATTTPKESGQTSDVSTLQAQVYAPQNSLFGFEELVPSKAPGEVSTSKKAEAVFESCREISSPLEKSSVKSESPRGSVKSVSSAETQASVKSSRSSAPEESRQNSADNSNERESSSESEETKDTTVTSKPCDAPSDSADQREDIDEVGALNINRDLERIMEIVLEQLSAAKMLRIDGSTEEKNATSDKLKEEVERMTDGISDETGSIYSRALIKLHDRLHEPRRSSPAGDVHCEGGPVDLCKKVVSSSKPEHLSILYEGCGETKTRADVSTLCHILTPEVDGSPARNAVQKELRFSEVPYEHCFSEGSQLQQPVEHSHPDSFQSFRATTTGQQSLCQEPRNWKRRRDTTADSFQSFSDTPYYRVAREHEKYNIATPITLPKTRSDAREVILGAVDFYEVTRDSLNQYLAGDPSSIEPLPLLESVRCLSTSQADATGKLRSTGKVEDEQVRGEMRKDQRLRKDESRASVQASKMFRLFSKKLLRKASSICKDESANSFENEDDLSLKGEEALLLQSEKFSNKSEAFAYEGPMPADEVGADISKNKSPVNVSGDIACRVYDRHHSDAKQVNCASAALMEQHKSSTTCQLQNITCVSSVPAPQATGKTCQLTHDTRCATNTSEHQGLRSAFRRILDKEPTTNNEDRVSKTLGQVKESEVQKNYDDCKLIVTEDDIIECLKRVARSSRSPVPNKARISPDTSTKRDIPSGSSLVQGELLNQDVAESIESSEPCDTKSDSSRSKSCSKVSSRPLLTMRKDLKEMLREILEEEYSHLLKTPGHQPQSQAVEAPVPISQSGRPAMRQSEARVACMKRSFKDHSSVGSYSFYGGLESGSTRTTAPSTKSVAFKLETSDTSLKENTTSRISSRSPNSVAEGHSATSTSGTNSAVSDTTLATTVENKTVSALSTTEHCHDASTTGSGDKSTSEVQTSSDTVTTSACSTSSPSEYTGTTGTGAGKSTRTSTENDYSVESGHSDSTHTTKEQQRSDIRTEVTTETSSESMVKSSLFPTQIQPSFVAPCLAMPPFRSWKDTPNERVPEPSGSRKVTWNYPTSYRLIPTAVTVESTESYTPMPPCNIPLFSDEKSSTSCTQSDKATSPIATFQPRVDYRSSKSYSDVYKAAPLPPQTFYASEHAYDYNTCRPSSTVVTSGTRPRSASFPGVPDRYHNKQEETLKPVYSAKSYTEYWLKTVSLYKDDAATSRSPSVECEEQSTGSKSMSNFFHVPPQRKLDEANVELYRNTETEVNPLLETYLSLQESIYPPFALGTANTCTYDANDTSAPPFFNAPTFDAVLPDIPEQVKVPTATFTPSRPSSHEPFSLQSTAVYGNTIDLHEYQAVQNTSDYGNKDLERYHAATHVIGHSSTANLNQYHSVTDNRDYDDTNHSLQYRVVTDSAYQSTTADLKRYNTETDTTVLLGYKPEPTIQSRVSLVGAATTTVEHASFEDSSQASVRNGRLAKKTFRKTASYRTPFPLCSSSRSSPTIRLGFRSAKTTPGAKRPLVRSNECARPSETDYAVHDQRSLSGADGRPDPVKESTLTKCASSDSYLSSSPLWQPNSLPFQRWLNTAATTPAEPGDTGETFTFCPSEKESDSSEYYEAARSSCSLNRRRLTHFNNEDM